MDNIVLVEREEEQRVMFHLLENAFENKLQLCFVAGNQGDGKTTFIESFILKAQENYDHHKLHCATGICDQSTRNDGAYDAFKDIFSQLTGVKANDIQNSIERKSPTNLQRTIHVATETLINIAPELIGILAPGVGLLTKALSISANNVIKNRIEISQNEKVKKDEIFFGAEEYFRKLSQKHPVILVLDDVQWIDKLSLELLHHLKHELKESPILIIAAYRPNEINEEDSLVKQLISTTRLEVENVIIDLNIDNLSFSKRKDFVNSFLLNNSCKVSEEFVGELLNRTGGKPLWLVELLRFLRQSGYLVQASGSWIEASDINWLSLPNQSTKLEALLEKRIQELEAELVEMLLIASVEGFEFTAQTISRIMGKTDRFVLSALETRLDKKYGFVKALNEEVIGEQALSHFRFTNIYYQEYLYEKVLGAGERRIIHSQVAESIEALYSTETNRVTLELSNQFRLALNNNKSVDYLIQLGQQQTLNRQLELAETTLKEAWSLAQATDYHSGSVKAMFHLAEDVIMGNTDRWDEAKNVLQSCIALARQEGYSKELSYALTSMGKIYRGEKKFTVAIFHYMESINLAQIRKDLIQEGKNLTNIGVVASEEGRHDDAKFFYDKRLELAKKVNYSDGIVVSYINLGDNARYRQDYEQARYYLQQAQEFLSKNPNPYRECAVLLSLAHLAVDENNISLAAKNIYTSQEIAIKKKYKDRKKDGLLCTVKVLAMANQEENTFRVWNALKIVANDDKKRQLEKETKEVILKCFQDFPHPNEETITIPQDILVQETQTILEQIQNAYLKV